MVIEYHVFFTKVQELIDNYCLGTGGTKRGEMLTCLQ